mgnify:CR=1 FL=1
MGERGQVHIKPSGVYLYTHWGADELISNVRDALAKKWRWNHPEYLTRIIFDMMKETDVTSETGYGIGTKLHGDTKVLVEINCENKTIKAIKYPNSKEYKKDLLKETSFTDFLKGDSK